MAGLRQRLLRRLGALCTIGLLLLPVVLSGHGHDGDASRSDTCARCVATHFSPATTAPPHPQPVPPLATVARAALDLGEIHSRVQPRPSGRAPPPFVTCLAV